MEGLPLVGDPRPRLKRREALLLANESRITLDFHSLSLCVRLRKWRPNEDTVHGPDEAATLAYAASFHLSTIDPRQFASVRNDGEAEISFCTSATCPRLDRSFISQRSPCQA